VVETLHKLDEDTRNRFERAVADAGTRGFRVLALAMRSGPKDSKPEEKDMKLIALFLLSDTLRSDAAGVISFLTHNGVRVKMLTGDNVAVASEVGKRLGLTGEIMHCQHECFVDLAEEQFDKTSIFAEILPEDKESLVRIAQKNHVVAVTGDGVNDLPAVRIANVGIAVQNAVDALKGTADIVLTQNGISVIKDAVLESRKIFTRIYGYSIYRISESFRVIVTVAFFGAFFFAPILTPLQLLILALLNDLPIISLAFNRVRVSNRPASIDVKKRFILSTVYGSVGIINSVLFFFLTRDFLHLSWDVIQTLFFLKLTVSGHMLVYVAHTSERWYKYLPSWAVIGATSITQGIATLLALFGVFMTGVSLPLVILVWVWAFFWMQVSDAVKLLRHHIEGKEAHAAHIAMQARRAIEA